MAVIAGTILSALNRAAIPGFIRAGVKATSAYNSMKLMGYGMRKTDFLGMFREMAGQEVKRITARALGMGRLPGPKSMISMTKTLPRKYLYKFTFNVYDEEGELIKEETTAVLKDELVTRRDAQDEAEANMEVGVYGIAGMYYEDFKLEEVLQSG